MEIEELLKYGNESANAGNFEQACACFAQVIKTDPNNAAGWLNLGKCLVEPEKKRFCFQRVLSINPGDVQAAQAMADIDQAAVPSPAKADELHIPDKSHQKAGRKKDVPWLRFLLLAAVSLVVCPVGLAAVMLFSNAFKGPAALPAVPNHSTDSPTFTQTLQRTRAPSSTFIPTRTRRPTWTPYATPTLPEFPMLVNPFDALPTYASPTDTPSGPLDANGYYRRAEQELDTRAIGGEDDYIARINQSLADVDQAIALNPTKGDYYSLRGDIYETLGSLAENNMSAQHLYALALVNSTRAIALGTSYSVPLQSVLIDMVFSNQCQKALDMDKQIIAKMPKSNHNLGGYLKIESQAYACLDNLTQALSDINDSMYNNENMDIKNELKMKYLVMLGRYDEALPILNQAICNCALAGYRYFWRAEIYFGSGKKDLVQNELDTGFYRTWIMGGIFPLVEAQLALDNDDKQDAIQELQEAEDSFPPDENPLRAKAHAMLATLGAASLVITPSSDYPATPIPQKNGTDQSALQTAIAEIGVNTPQTSNGLSIEATETPTSNILAYSTPAAFTGIGPFILPAQDDILFEFKPGNQTLDVHFVKSLTLHTKITDPAIQTQAVINFSLWSPSNGGWGINQGNNQILWGTQTINIKVPADFVNSNGAVWLDIRNTGKQNETIEELSLTMDYLDSKGQESVINSQP
jgi:tetratricopeptide (TPR) repeat protein